MVDVFISYSRSDLAAVTRLAEAVEAAGYDVWWDADLPPHLSYGDVITAKIGMAKAAIVVWSKDSAASEWVRAEADMARNQKKLVQTALGDVMPPLPFNQIQFAEIGDWHGEADHPGWRKVKASLAELCGRAPGADVRPERGERERAIAPPPAASKWPLFAGVAVGAAALAAAGWIVLREPGEPSSPMQADRPTLATPAAPPEPAAAPQAAAPTEPAAPAEPLPPALGIASPEGRVFPDSSVRLLRSPEVASLGPATLAIARNEIFARKGRRFARAEIREYFEQFDWYRPVADEVELTAIERQNVALLRRMEARFGG